MGLVAQESVLFHTTIRENIRMGRPDATDAEVEAAACAAELQTVLASLPLGYQTRWVSVGGGSRAGNGSGWPLPGPSCVIQTFWCSTR